MHHLLLIDSKLNINQFPWKYKEILRITAHRSNYCDIHVTPNYLCIESHVHARLLCILLVGCDAFPALLLLPAAMPKQSCPKQCIVHAMYVTFIFRASVCRICFGACFCIRFMYLGMPNLCGAHFWATEGRASCNLGSPCYMASCKSLNHWSTELRSSPNEDSWKRRD